MLINKKIFIDTSSGGNFDNSSASKLETTFKQLSKVDGQWKESLEIQIIYSTVVRFFFLILINNFVEN